MAASVNLKGGYDNYDNGYLMQYKINSDGGLSYNGYARIGKNAEQVKLNNYNHLILNTSAGGYQNYGSVNEETSLDYVILTEIILEISMIKSRSFYRSRLKTMAMISVI